MMNCSSCGSQLPAGAKVCPHCGIAVSAYSWSAGSSSPDAGSNAFSYSYGSQPGSSSTSEPTRAASPSTPPSSGPPLPGAYGSNADAPFNWQGSYPSPSFQQPYSPLPPPPPYISAQPGSSPGSPAVFMPAGSQGQKPPRRSPVGFIILLTVLLVALIAGSGLIYYGAVYQPGQVHVQATATAEAQATAAARNPYTSGGKLALSDPLRDNSKGYNWDEDPTNCHFVGGTYHAVAPNPRYSDYCVAQSTDFSDFAFEAQMQIIQGDGGGLLFRVGNTAGVNKFYAFYINQDGSYGVSMANGSSYTGLTSSTSSAIKQGLNQTNLIAIVAQGGIFNLYVNNQQIATISDNTFSQGRIGFIASTFGSNGHATEVIFTNARVWSL